jgi:hypothetical protein
MHPLRINRVCNFLCSTAAALHTTLGSSVVGPIGLIAALNNMSSDHGTVPPLLPLPYPVSSWLGR